MKRYPHLRRWLLAAASLTVLTVTVVIGVGAPSASEQASDKPAQRDWPLFGGSPQRNLVNTFDRNIPSSWSLLPGKETHLKWVAELGSKAYGGPVIAGGKIFVGTNNEKPRNPKIQGDRGILMCFRESDGQFLWQAVHDKLASGRVNDWPREGICSAPVVQGNRLYYVSNRCEVICADTEGTPGTSEAKIIWRLDMIRELGVFPHNLATCSPLIVGDLLFTVTSNGVDEGHISIPKPEAPSFLAIDRHTGKVLWQSNVTSVKLVEELKQGGDRGSATKRLLDKGEILMHGQWSNPVYAEPNGKPQIIFPGGDGWLYAFAPKTGQLIWKFDCNPKNAVYKLGREGTRNDFVSTPVVCDNKLYIGVGQDPEHDAGVGHLWCIDITRQGNVSPVDDNFDPRAPVNRNSALVWHYGGPAPEGADRDYVFGRTLSTCAIHDGLLYTAEFGGIVHCLDAQTGAKYWEHNMRAKTWSSPHWVDGKVFIGNDKNKLLVFAHGKEKKLLAEIDMRGKVRATPVACNGVLYVMTENKLHAIR